MDNFPEIFSSIHLKNYKLTIQLLQSIAISEDDRSVMELYCEFLQVEDSQKDEFLHENVKDRENSPLLQILEFLLTKEYMSMDLEKVEEINEIFQIIQQSSQLEKFLFSEILKEIAFYLVNQAMYTLAKDYLSEAITWKQAISDIHGLGLLYNRVGVIHIRQGELDKALKIFNHAIGIFTIYNDYNNLALLLNNVGGVFLSKGNIEIARSNYNQALEYANAVNNKQLNAMLFNNLGIIHYERGELKLSLDYYEKSLHIKEILDKDVNLAPTLHNIGKIHGREGDYFLALEYLKRSLVKCSADIPELKANTLNEIITYHSYLFEFGKAMSYLSELEEMVEYYKLPIIEQYWLLSEAIILKSNDLVGYKQDALHKFETLINAPVLHIEITKTAILNYMELLMTSKTSYSSAISELKNLVTQLYKINQEHLSIYGLVESILLKSMYSFVVGEDQLGLKLLLQAEITSTEFSLNEFISRCQHTREIFGSEQSNKGKLTYFIEEIISAR